MPKPRSAAVPPGTEPLRVLRDHLEAEASRLDDRRRELAAATEALARIRVSGEDRPDSALEPLSAAVAPGVVSALLHETTGMTRSYVMAVDEGPALDDRTLRDNQERITAGMRQRALYPVAALGTPHGMQWIQNWAAIGEEQRVVTEAATEFAVFGVDAVVSLTEWGNIGSGYVLSREPLVIAAFTAYFDAAWAAALPVPTAPEDRDVDAHLVQLLGMGLKDEAIARYLGIGLRTVRRRVARLMAVHGVETRYQLGAALERSGRPTRRGR